MVVYRIARILHLFRIKRRDRRVDLLKIRLVVERADAAAVFRARIRINKPLPRHRFILGPKGLLPLQDAAQCAEIGNSVRNSRLNSLEHRKVILPDLSRIVSPYIAAVEITAHMNDAGIRHGRPIA